VLDRVLDYGLNLMLPPLKDVDGCALLHKLPLEQIGHRYSFEPE
jgi:hypothetical protein